MYERYVPNSDALMTRVVKYRLQLTLKGSLLAAACQFLFPGGPAFSQVPQLDQQPRAQAQFFPGGAGSPGSGQPFGSAMTAPQPYSQSALPYKPFSGFPGFTPQMRQPDSQGPLIAPPITFIDV